MDDLRQHSLEHRVRFDECDAGGILRAGGFLRVMQDLAWRHSEAMGYDRAWYLEHRLTWLVRYADLRIVGEVGSGETMSVTTQVTGWRRVWARRRSEVILEPAGARVATATIDWVLIDAQGRPARVPPGIAERFTDGASTFTPGRVSLSAAPAAATRYEWTVGIRDLDPMAHVNNATYLDVLDEALAADTGALAGPRPPARYQVEYLRPALPRATVSVVHWQADGNHLARFTDRAGEELIRAQVHAG
jgi:acyl-CoA thioesterase FadM